MKRVLIAVLVAGLLGAITLTACNGTLDSNVATLNAAATAAAGGNIDVTLPSIPIATLLTPLPTNPPNTYDLTTDPNADVARTWGLIYNSGSGSTFTLRATNTQAAAFIIAFLQLNGWQSTVQGGSVAMGSGQIRIDLALQVKQNDQTQFGSGTVTFQPTLDAAGGLHLNPLGAVFGALPIQSNFISSTGDAVHALLTGATNDFTTGVSLSQISLENGVMSITGTVR